MKFLQVVPLLVFLVAFLSCNAQSGRPSDHLGLWEPDETSRLVENIGEAEVLAGFRPLVPAYIPDGYQQARTSVLRLQHPPGSVRDYTYQVTTNWLPVERNQGPRGLGLLLTQSSVPQDLEEVLEHGPPDEYLGDWVEFGPHRGVLTPQVSLHWNTDEGHAMTLRVAPGELSKEELIQVAESTGMSQGRLEHLQ